MGDKIRTCPVSECPTPRLARLYDRRGGKDYYGYRDPFGHEVLRCMSHGVAIVGDEIRLVGP